MATGPQDDRFYKPSRLLKVFGLSSVAMMVCTFWMVLDDYGREWKGYQKDFFVLRQKKLAEQIEAAKTQVDAGKVTELTLSIKKAEEALKSKEQEIGKTNKELVQLIAKERIAVSKFQDRKAVWDVEKYGYEAKYGHKIVEGQFEKVKANANKAMTVLQKNWELVISLRDKANLLTQQVSDKQKELNAFTEEKSSLEKEKSTVRGELERLEATREATRLTLKSFIRNAPILDMASPVFKLQQVVLPTIRDDVNFATVQKVDRCTTCHMAIDQPGFENEKNPFKTHPKLDLILGSRSPHPIDKIGCTVCHDGRGQATHFVRSGHTPQHKEQEKNWQKVHGWNEHDQHHIIEKMLPLQHTEGKCRTCHQETEYVPRAEKLNAAVQLVRSAGCYGCHRIEGWDHLRKPAPSLKKIKGKVSKDWFVKWVRDPKSFNEYARMPSVFHQSNIQTDEQKVFQEAEIFAITDFVLSQSDSYSPNTSLPLGSKERGKEIFSKVGCLGCHQIDDFGRDRGRFVQAPDLSTVGSKVSPAWLASWLKNPKHYWEETTMPSLRLSNGEISHLAAYLSSKKNTPFDELPVGQVDLAQQRNLLKLYLMRDPKLAPVTTEKVEKVVSGLKPHEISLKLGENAMLRYGCFGCHEIKSFEKTPGIGTELTEEGSKPVNKLDFGLLHLEHTNHAWFHGKLTNTRMFDKGLAKDYLDLLRMPQYGFDEEERNQFVLFLLGLTPLRVAAPTGKVLNAREAKIEEGLRVVHKYNCQGCHVVEKMWSPLPDDHPDRDKHEKDRFRLEGRILSHYAEDETLGPPPLVTEGRRVYTGWAYHFLENPLPQLRLKLDIRMPTFQLNREELNKIVSYFGHDGNVEFPVTGPQRISLSASELRVAKTLFNRLQCLNCHTLGEKLAPSQLEGSRGLAPDLLLSHKRLRREWIVELLKDPQKMIPGTRMPGFWPDGNSPLPDLLSGNSQAQINLLTDYILSLGQSRSE